jgi:hypothetical protein
MGIGNRIRAASLKHPFSTNRKVDIYLSENLGLLLDEYKVADRSDLLDVETEFNGIEKRMESLEGWRSEMTEKLSSTRARLDRMKNKYGVE